jgi:Outer membrane protein beta-barrel domain
VSTSQRVSVLHRTLAAAALSAISATAYAQETTRPLQVSVEYSALGLVPESGRNTGVSGFGVRVDYRLTRRIDVEGRALWFPSKSLQEFQAQGGRTSQFGAGIRGRFIATERASFYGLLLPELLHFSDAIVDLGGSDITAGGTTHFALDWGLGAEIKANDRWAVHGDFTGPLYMIRETPEDCSEPGPNGAVLCFSLAPRIVNVWQVSAGVSYSLGPIRHQPAEEPVVGAWEIGGQLGAVTTAGALTTTLRTLPALGGFLSYRLFPATYADAAVSFSTRDVRVRTAWDGGHLTQALGGVKIGARKDGYGLFGKVRLGVNSQSGAVSAMEAGHVRLSRANALAIDLGGVFEQYFARGLLIRFDGGDTISVFGPTTYVRNGITMRLPAPEWVDSLQMSLGFGWRF